MSRSWSIVASAIVIGVIVAVFLLRKPASSVTAPPPASTEVRVAPPAMPPPLPPEPEGVDAAAAPPVVSMPPPQAPLPSADAPADPQFGVRPADAPDPVPTLEQMLQTDPDVHHRLMAIDALQRMGISGDNSGRIRAALEAAQSDADPTVAVSARDALSVLKD